MANFKEEFKASIKKTKDGNPKWESCDQWDTNHFLKFFKDSMDYYRLEKTSKDLKPEVIKWMENNSFDDDDIKSVKDSKDWRCNLTMGSIAANLNRGMPAMRPDFNEGRNTAEWLCNEIHRVIKESIADKLSISVDDPKPAVPVPSIQDRLRDTSMKMAEEIDYAIDSFVQDPESFDPRAFKVFNLFKGKQVKAAHARLIKEFYASSYAEIADVVAGKCEQLNEGYKNFSKKQIRKLFDFYQEVCNSCDMIMQESKVNKKPRIKKSVSVEKLASKLKFCKTDDQFKLVSVNPTEIIGSKELWVFNRKTRKLGKYIAEEYMNLGIKGTTITGFNANTSVQKTLRKPMDQLKTFKDAGKIQLRKFLEEIKSTDIKLNGRINEDVLLLKTVK